jgi:hypothetical protein
MSLLCLGALGVLGLTGALAGAVVGHPTGPIVCYPRYYPSFNSYYGQPYSYPMMASTPMMGMGPIMGMGMGPSYYPWSPMSRFQPSMSGYW